jgi:uncharacterized integral membrane protein
MATLKTLLWLFFVLFIVAISILFSLQNSTPIGLDLLVMSMPPLPVSLWLLLSFVFGAIFGLLAAGWSVIKLRSANHLLRRKLQQSDNAISALKNTSSIATP